MAISLSNGLSMVSENKLWNGVGNPQRLRVPASFQMRASAKLVIDKLFISTVCLAGSVGTAMVSVWLMGLGGIVAMICSIIPEIEFEGEVSLMSLLITIQAINGLNILCLSYCQIAFGIEGDALSGFLKGEPMDISFLAQGIVKPVFQILGVFTLDLSSILEFAYTDMFVQISTTTGLTILIGSRTRLSLQAICDLAPGLFDFLCVLFVPDISMYSAVNVYLSERGMGILFDTEMEFKRTKKTASSELDIEGTIIDFFIDLFFKLMGWPKGEGASLGMEISMEFENNVYNLCLRIKYIGGSNTFCTAQCTEHEECPEGYFCGGLFGKCMPKKEPRQLCGFYGDVECLVSLAMVFKISLCCMLLLLIFLLNRCF